jgi:hypothetical protein
MAGIESSRYYNEVPTVQFRTLKQFIADLKAGVVDTVYHDLDERPLHDWESYFRAIVTTGNGPHIASLSFRRTALRAFDGDGRERVLDNDEQFRYQEGEHNELVEKVAERLSMIGILSLREGAVSLSHWTVTVFARQSKEAPAE